ncbi:MAG: lactonase family protein [Lentisphaeria bacterium]|nr:lactonase family protein [Lentisphaeria bacterium]
MPYILLFILSFFTCYAQAPLYVASNSEGIYLMELNFETGELNKKVLQKESTPSGFIALTEDRNFLYATTKGNVVRAYKINEDNSLTFLNEVPVNSKGPCHITVLPGDKAVVTANYSGGDVSFIPLKGNGFLKKNIKVYDYKQFKASEQNKRQMKAHAHQVKVGPTQKYLYVSDLGLDKIIIFKILEDGKGLKLNTPAFAEAPQGAGPRHICLHKKLPYAYGINELNGTISVYLHRQDGSLTPIQQISTLPENFNGYNASADIHVHPSGKYVLASNRGPNSLAIFSINQKNGKLIKLSNQPVLGDWPRNFAISPKGKFVIVGNQKSNQLQTFKFDTQEGNLIPLKNSPLKQTMCIKFK